jgi:4a-hydroxytetrahydrobiopterin dehydratase
MTELVALTEAQIADRLSQLDDWKLNSGGMLSKTFELDSYVVGLAFACAVGTIGERLAHHPDLLITWRKVRVELITHDVGNKLSYMDFEVATAIETLPYPV